MPLDMMLTTAWLLGAAVILAAVLGMAIKRRFLAATVTAIVAALASAPFYLELGQHAFTVLKVELAVAIIVGVPALAYARRWLALTVFLPLTVLPLTVFILTDLRITQYDAVPNILRIALAVGSLLIMCAPAFLVVASAFFIGSFIERRPYRAEG